MPKLVGNYYITGSLGEGSFGWIYTGHHSILGTEVPVCLKREKTQQEPFIRMFKEEAILLSKMRHPALPSFQNYLEIPGKEGLERFIVLSFIQGESLDKTLESGPISGRDYPGRHIDDEHICWILDRILYGLAYLHGRHQIVHCDIKPGNCIIDIDNHEVILVDLGMAASRPNADTLAKGGTPGYLPPEFALGLPPIAQSDFYSVGKIGIALAGGNIQQGEPPTDMRLQLREFLMSLIRKDPMSRPSNANELRTQLADLRKSMFNRIECLETFKRRPV